MATRAIYLPVNKLWLNNYYDASDTMHCQKTRCKEELNGLNCYYIELVKGFKFSIWLCDKHAKLLEQETKR